MVRVKNLKDFLLMVGCNRKVLNASELGVFMNNRNLIIDLNQLIASDKLRLSSLIRKNEEIIPGQRRITLIDKQNLNTGGHYQCQ